MDAHSFHSITRELIAFLQGARIEKIHGPLPHTFLFSLFAQKQKFKLLFSAQKNAPCLCLTKQTLTNPQNPRADVMRLRKFIMGKRIVQGYSHFTTRRLAFSLSSAPETPPLYLIFTWRDGLFLEETLPEDFFAEPLWAPTHLLTHPTSNSSSHLPIKTPQANPNTIFETTLVDPSSANSASSISLANTSENIPLWQQYSTLTPLVREVLPYLSHDAMKDFFTLLSSNNSSLYCYIDTHNTLHYTAFALPEQVQTKKKWKEIIVAPSLVKEEMTLEVYNPEQTTLLATLPILKGFSFTPNFLLTITHNCEAAESFENETPLPAQVTPQPHTTELQYFAALTLASWIEEHNFFARLATEIGRQEEAPEKKLEKKQARLQKKLEEEGKRLLRMVALREHALLLQQYLWMFAPDAKEDFVELPIPVPSNAYALLVEETQDERKRTTAEQNAEKESKQNQQKATTLHIPLNSQLTICENMEHMFHQSARGLRGLNFLHERRTNPHFVPPQAKPQQSQQKTNKQERLANYAAVHRKKDEQKHVAEFISSQGFTILRGKNAEGNKAIIKMGQPHDIWLHSKDGPSAHALLRRAHGAQEIPEATLEEAAILVGLKSWQKDDKKAEIMLAEIRHVRGHKGRYAGAALANKLLGTTLVTLNQELETTLLPSKDS